jgi:hypothetical protein
MARKRSGDAQVLHDLIARFESGPGLQLFSAQGIAMQTLTRLERIVVAIQFVVVAILMMTAVATLWLP